MADTKKQIFLWYGNNDFAIQEKRALWTEAFRKKYSGLNIILLDAAVNESRSELAVKIKNALQINSLFGLNKLIVFTNFLTSINRLGAEASALVVAALSSLAPTFFLVFIEGETLDEKSALYRAIRAQEKEQKVEIERFDLPTAGNLTKWVKARAKKYEAGLTPGAINLLTALVGNNLWQLDQEVQKLANYQPAAVINETAVKALVRGKYNDDIFELMDALGAWDKKKVVTLLGDQIQSGAEDMYLLTMLARQVRIFLQIKELLTAGVTEAGRLADELHLHPYVVKKGLTQVKNFSLAQLKNFQQQFLEFEYQIKTKNVSLSVLFESMIAGL